MSKGGRYLNNPQKTVKEPGRKASGKKIALIIVAVILALVVILGVGAVAFFKSIIGKRTKVQTVRPTLPPVTAPVDDTKPTDTPKATETAPTEETKPDYGKTGKVVNVLVVGQAAREGEEAKISDSIMLATINKETSTVTVTSFLRDTYIQLASPYVDTTGRTRTCGHNKINMAYALVYSWGGAVLGAPLTHDFAVISLSDRLTPWEKIEARLDAAAKADLSIAIYNPKSKGRPDHLRRACGILLNTLPEDRLCGVVRNIGREGEERVLLTLKELQSYDADMFCTVFIGNSMTRNIGGNMVTPRGYRDV